MLPYQLNNHLISYMEEVDLDLGLIIHFNKR